MAWKLHRHGSDVDIDARPPGTILAVRGSRIGGAERFAPMATTQRWTVRRACGS